MGSGASTAAADVDMQLASNIRHAAKAREAYLDTADVASLQEARAELAALRALTLRTFDAIDSGDSALGLPADVYSRFAAENGHSHVREEVASSREGWLAMNAKFDGRQHGPEAVKSWTVGFIADQDSAVVSKSGDHAGKVWESYFATGELTYVAASCDASCGGAGHREGALDATASATEGRYEFRITDDMPIGTSEGDKSGRGAEYSLLEYYNGKLVTACDRTGNLDEIYVVKPPPPGTGEKATSLTPEFAVRPVVDATGQRVVLLMGNGGKKGKGLKCEWSTLVPGPNPSDGEKRLLVGSTGKERTDDAGQVVHEGEMWVKELDSDFKVTHVDWSAHYANLRAPTKCQHGRGYMVHESARWSEVHERWFFFPRKLSRTPYDEVADEGKCCNLFLSAPADLSAAAEPGALLLQPLLTFLPLRGCSDFFFVPGSNDCHLFIIRTEETLSGDTSTHASVVDLCGTVLMAEQLIGQDRKFEGACLLPDSFLQRPPKLSGEPLAVTTTAATATTMAPIEESKGGGGDGVDKPKKVQTEVQPEVLGKGVVRTSVTASVTVSDGSVALQEKLGCEGFVGEGPGLG